MILTEEHKKFIKKHLKDGEKLLHRQDTWEILDALDYLMLYEGFGSDDEPTEWGLEIERIRDEIYTNNEQ